MFRSFDVGLGFGRFEDSVVGVLCGLGFVGTLTSDFTGADEEDGAAVPVLYEEVGVTAAFHLLGLVWAALPHSPVGCTMDGFGRPRYLGLRARASAGEGKEHQPRSSRLVPNFFLRRPLSEDFCRTVIPILCSRHLPRASYP